MGHRLSRAATALALAASLLLPVRPVEAGSALPSHQDVSTTFQINASHDGHLAGGTQRPPLTKKWARDIGGAVSYPVIAEGKVFVTAAVGPGTTLFALDAATGNNAWAPVALGSTYSFSAVAYGAGRVFAVNDNGRVSAFTAATGAVEWSIQLPARVNAPPTYRNGRVFIGTGVLWALAEADGAVLWSRRVEPGSGASSSGPPIVTDTAVYVVYGANEAYAYDPATGTRLWYNPAPYVTGLPGPTAVLADGRLWTRDLGYDPDLILDPATGAVTGTYRSGLAPAFDGHTGFFTVGRVLEARDTRADAVLWSFAGDGELSTTPIVVNGYVYVGSSTGQFWALDGTNGQPVWGDNVGARIFGSGESSYIHAGIGAGQGLVVLPASTILVAYAGPPPGVRSPWIASVLGDVASPALGNDPSPPIVVSGVVAGEVVAIKDGDVVRATKTVPAAATTVTFNAGPADTEVSVAGDGDHPLSAVVVGGGELVRPSGVFTYAFDTVPPPAPTVWVDEVSAKSPSGNVWSPRVWVSDVGASQTATLMVDGVVRATRVASSTGGGVTFNYPQAAPDFVLPGPGTYQLTATASEVAGNVSAPSSPAVVYEVVNDPGRFHPLTPSRILDTRVGTGGITAPIGPNATVAVPVAGRGGVPATGASAVAVNVTVTQPSVGGFLTVFPAGGERPLASSLNFVAGETVPNLVMAKLGTDGKVSIYNSNGTSHVIVDVVGWYQEEGASAGGLYNPVSPSRILDTRDGTGGISGPMGPGAAISVGVLGRGGVPLAPALGVILNVTVTQPSVGGFLTVYPTGSSRPLASSLNFVAGQTVPNLVVAKVGQSGAVDIYNNAGTAHVVVDVVGWFGVDWATDGSRYNTLSPSRILDTRTGAGPAGPGGTVKVPVAGRGGVPASGATAVAVNVTVTQPSAGGYLTVFPGGTDRPLASNLNFVAGETVPNLVVAKLGADGSIDVYNNAGTTHLVVDVVGWYGP